MADAALETSLSDVGTSSPPLPEMPAARSGGTGLTADALESAAVGGLFALRNTCADCVWGGQQRARGRRSPPAFGAHVSGHYAALRAAAHSSCGPPDARPALWAAVFLAFGVDALLASDVVLGVRPVLVGDVPASEGFAPEVE